MFQVAFVANANEGENLRFFLGYWTSVYEGLEPCPDVLERFTRVSRINENTRISAWGFACFSTALHLC